MFYQVILLMYRYIYYFENLCITDNNVIDFYIMDILLKQNHFGVDVTKTKHGINLRQNTDTKLSKQKNLWYKIIFFNDFF